MPTIKIPQAGKSAHSATVRRWLKKPGDSIATGDILAELETEEGLLEVQAPLSGILGQILLAAGSTAAFHAPLATIEEAAAPKTPATRQPKEHSPVASPSGTVTPVLMPKAGQSMEEGTILQWRVKVGDTINRGEVIFEIETDKATMEVEATDSGRLARIVVPEGGMLAVLQPVAYLADNDADVDAYIAAQGTASPAAQASPSAQAQAAAPAAVQPAAVLAPAVTDGGRVKASPAARKLAADRNIDLRTVAAGTGPAGRILSGDVPLTAPATGPSRRRMSQMRKAIARNLLLSKQTIPHFYMRLTLNAEPMLAFYQQHKAQYPCSINDVIVLACSRVIHEFPAFRSRIEGDDIVESPSANIGIAVGLDDGLVVPVLVGADRMDLRQVGTETKRLATSARGGKIEGMGQGSFTITNLGMFGTEEFAAIINPPEAAILAVGAVRETIIVKDGAMRPGKVMTVTLSADHRVVDGMLAAKFLAKLKELLENPAQLG